MWQSVMAFYYLIFFGSTIGVRSKMERGGGGCRGRDDEVKLSKSFTSWSTALVSYRDLIRTPHSVVIFLWFRAGFYCFTMVPLLTFGLPLPQSAPPTGYGCSDCALSDSSTTTAFNIGLYERDQFLGSCRCIVCGRGGYGAIDHCHIIMASEPHTVSENSIWALLRLMWRTVGGSQGAPLDP